MSHSAQSSKRRWLPRFSLKTLLIMVAVSGAFFGYLGHLLRRVTIQRRIVTQIKQAGGSVIYDWQFGTEHDLDRMTVTGIDKPPGPAVLRRMLGDDVFAYVKAVSLGESATHRGFNRRLLLELPRLKGVTLWYSQVSDESLASISECPELRSLGLHGNFGKGTATQTGLAQLQRARKLDALHLAGEWLTDDAMLAVAQLRQLRRLSISSAPQLSSATLASVGQLTELRELSFQFAKGIDDEGLDAISRLPYLRHLSFTATAVTDAGLPIIGHMTQLEYLNLWSTEVTDAGLPHLRSLVNLKELDVCCPHTTKDAANELRKALPSCSVHLRDEKGRLFRTD